MPWKPTWTEEELREAVLVSKSTAEVVRRLGLASGGSSHSRVLKKIKELGLSREHFKKGNWFANGEFKKQPKPLSEVMIENSTFNSNHLKNRLIKENLWVRECHECGINSWRGKDLPLEIHHINNNNKDNRLHNLILLCPNCHAQTESWRNNGSKKRNQK